MGKTQVGSIHGTLKGGGTRTFHRWEKDSRRRYLRYYQGGVTYVTGDPIAKLLDSPVNWSIRSNFFKLIFFWFPEKFTVYPNIRIITKVYNIQRISYCHTKHSIFEPPTHWWQWQACLCVYEMIKNESGDVIDMSAVLAGDGPMKISVTRNWDNSSQWTVKFNFYAILELNMIRYDQFSIVNDRKQTLE